MESNRPDIYGIAREETEYDQQRPFPEPGTCEAPQTGLEPFRFSPGAGQQPAVPAGITPFCWRS